MKKNLLLLVLIVSFSCKKEIQKEVKKETNNEIITQNFPKELRKVFKYHGGIKAWRNAKVLSFNKGQEVHTVDLQSRKVLINAPKYSIGFDGKEVWLQQDSIYFKGNKNFYYNLYFYFYAMPFVLSDNGIVYEKTEDLIFNGTQYPGIKISFKADVGSSPDDNYKLYYNPNTYQMEWLAYTVTFNSKKASDKFKLVKYNKWENVNGLLLPKEITWYKKDENGKPTEPAKPATVFTFPLISQGKLSDSFFEKPKE